MASLQKTITDIFEEINADPSLFLVKLTITPGKYQKVKLALDGDEGVTVDQCATISRKLGHQIEERELIANAFTLEVSSLGADESLVLLRQYPKNIGRKLKVSLQDKSEKTGQLMDVSQEQNSIILAVETKEKVEGKKKKELVIREEEIPFDNIKKCMVIFSIN
jgi:ribosome maturation factor RimP